MIHLLVACGGSLVIEPDEAVSGSSERLPDVEDDDTGDGSDALFGVDRVHRIEITFSEEAEASLRADGDLFVLADVEIDGEDVADVGLHLKGKIGSGRTLDQKTAFKIDFNRFVPDQKFGDLKAMTLNNMVNDASFVHESIAYPVYTAAGIPGLRTGYAWVTVNGEDFGLYLDLETPDDEFLQRAFEDPTGNLYEADYLLHDDGSYTLLDFDPALADLYNLDEGVDNGHADLHALADAIAATRGTPDFYATVGVLLDWDRYLRFWAVEMWVGQWDGYDYNTNNYYVYFDPTTGQAMLLPWGQDWTFTGWADYYAPTSLLPNACLRDETCFAALRVAVDEVCDAADALDLPTRIDTLAALIEDRMRADPRKEVGPRGVHASQDATRLWVESASASLRATWGL